MTSKIQRPVVDDLNITHEALLKHHTQKKEPSEVNPAVLTYNFWSL